MWNHDCFLGYYKEIKDEETLQFSKTIVFDEESIFCTKKSVSQTEFYQASSSGFKPDIKIIVKSIDYDDQEYLKFNDKIYKVIRTFETKEDEVELVLTRSIDEVIQ